MEHDGTFSTQHGQGCRMDLMSERVGFVRQMYAINFVKFWDYKGSVFLIWKLTE